MNSDQYKQQVYKNWISRGRPWFDIDKSKEPTYAERQIVLEMIKQENSRIKRNLERPKPKNEVKAFDRLFRDVANY